MAFKFQNFNIDEIKPDVPKTTSRFRFDNLDRAVTNRLSQKAMEVSVQTIEKRQEQLTSLTSEAQKLSSPFGILKETFKPRNLWEATKQLPGIIGGFIERAKPVIKETVKTGTEAIPAFTQGSKWEIGKSPEQNKENIEIRRNVLIGSGKNLAELASGTARTTLQIGLYINPYIPKEQKEIARKRIKESEILNYKPEYTNKYQKFGAGATEFGTWFIPITRLKTISTAEKAIKKAITGLPFVSKILGKTPTIVKGGGRFFYEVGKDVADVAILNQLRGKSWEESKKDLAGVAVGGAVIRGGLKLFSGVGKKTIGGAVTTQGNIPSKQFLDDLASSFGEQTKGQFTDPELRKMVFNPNGSINPAWAVHRIDDAARKLDSGYPGQGVGKFFRNSIDINNIPNPKFMLEKSLEAIRKKAGIKITESELSKTLGRTAGKIIEKTDKEPTLSVVEFIKRKPNITVEETKTLGKDIGGKLIKSRLEWDFRNNKGKLIITPQTTEDDLAHEIGHILRRERQEILEETKDEVIKLTGGKKNLNEDFADAVKDIIGGEKKGTPKLTRIIEEEGIKIKSVKLIPSKKSELTTQPAKRPVQIEDKKPKLKIEEPRKKESLAEATQETKSKFEQQISALIEREKTLIQNMKGSQKEAKQKAIGMEYSAIKRNITGEPTAIELQNAKKYLESNYRGKRIVVGKETGVVTGKVSFGKHEVKLENGIKKYFVKEEIKSKPITIGYVKQYIKERAIQKLEGKEKLFGIKPSAKKIVTPKEKFQRYPTAVKNIAKKTYKREIKAGAPKKEAAKKAITKVKKYEEKTAVIAKRVPVIDTLVKDRKYGSTPAKKVKTEGINWKTVNTSTETEEIIDGIFKGSKQFKNVRPSRTNKDIIEGARMVDIDVNNPAELDRLVKTFPNANVAHKLKQALVDSAADLKEFIRTVGDFTLATPEQLKMLKSKFIRTQGIARAFSGMRTESSHLLRSMGIEVVEGENQILEELGRGLQRAAKESGEDLSIETLTKFLKKQQKLIEPTRGDKALAIWYNSILSGWKTWTRNILDTSFSLFSETLSKAANPITLLEVPRFIAGIIKNLRYSIPEAIQVLKGKRVVQKYTTRGVTFGQTFKNKHVNTFFELSGRVLDAQDTVFSGTIRGAEKGIEKQLRKAGIDNPQLVDELNQAILAQFSERITYRNRPMGVLGKISEKLGSLTNVVKPLKVILPFTRVVANVLDRKIDLIPLLNLSRTFGKKYITEEAKIILGKTNIPMSKWDDLIPVVSKRLKQQQLGRLYFGTLLTAGTFVLARNNKLTGSGPANKNERDQLKETGWRPYSIKMGKRYIPYSYFGPLSGILAIAGSIGDEFRYNKKDEKIWEKIATGLNGFAGATLDQSFLSGISDLFEVLSGNLDPGRYFRNLVTGLIPYPAILQQTKSAIDGKSYDIQTWEEAIKYKFGVTKNLTPRLNALGEEIRADLIYGITPSEEKDNLQKQLSQRGLKVNIPAKTTKIEDQEMTREQLWKYTKIRGEMIKKNANNILNSVDKKQSQEDKEKEFQLWIDDISEEAKKQIRLDYGIPIKKTSTKRKIDKRTIIK